jgi:hypothetical protein
MTGLRGHFEWIMDSFLYHLIYLSSTTWSASKQSSYGLLVIRIPAQLVSFLHSQDDGMSQLRSMSDGESESE